MLKMLSLALLTPAAAFAGVEFNKDIRPILADACFHCHGPDPGTRKAGLRLDTEAGFFTARKGEEPTVIKGQPEKSSLYQRLLSTDEDEIMPPPESHKELKPAQIAMIKTWIEQGAPWQPHWSLIPPQKPAEPTVKDKTWGKSPVDRFVLSKLEEKGLKPAPEADAHALIRRVSLDLTGLPPSPELVNRYATADKLTDAQLNALADELMKSPAYGEHRARYWLDAARYGDSHGLHFDKPREMWPYRDWVVNAFNRNLPFDQFTIEQIAGDLLPKPTEDQLVATGFQRCNITTNEGGTIDEENLANYAADRVQTMGWVYMGLTTNCSQCHDHKFDPITQRDYYSMAAFFRNTTQKAKDGNVKDGLGPVLVLPAEKDRPRWTALPAEIAASQKLQNEARTAAAKPFETWFATAKPADLAADIPTKGIIAHIPLNEGKGQEVAATCGETKTAKTFKSAGVITWKPDGKLGPAPEIKPGSNFDLGDVGNFEKEKPFSYGLWFRSGNVTQSGSILARMDEKNGFRGWDIMQSANKVSVHIISKWPSDALKVTTAKPALRAGVWQHLFVTYDGKGKVGGLRIYVDGVDTPVKTDAASLKGSIVTSTPTKIGQRSSTPLREGGVQDIRLYDRQLTATEVQTLAKVVPLQQFVGAKKIHPKNREALFDHYLATRDKAYQTASTQTNKLTAEKEAIKARSPITHIQEEKMDAKPMANILMRGAYDKVGEQVDAAVPAALGKLAPDAPKNRLGLAQWLVDAKNPLTARVTVNRFWQELFGAGIVKTSDDFGIMGSAPTHPELLDWLAVEFRESGWDVKRFLKMLLTSATYRQAALITPEKIEKDRDNSLLSRGPRFRMDAEMIRDHALAVSGLLHHKVGGPSVYPVQVPNLWKEIGFLRPEIGMDEWPVSDGPDLYRRALYTFWRRVCTYPTLATFDAPSREVCVSRRPRTNTPLQALAALNEPTLLEAARFFGQRILAEGGPDDASRVDYAFTRSVGRAPTAVEQRRLLAFVQQQERSFRADPEAAQALIQVGQAPKPADLEARKLAVWMTLASVLFNLDETLTKG